MLFLPIAEMALQPPADTVTDGVYALRTIPVPRLTGRALQAFVTVMENVGSVLAPTIMHQSGMTSALRDKRYPEVPLFSSVPPHPSAPEPDTTSIAPSEAPTERVAAALAALDHPPGSAPSADRPTCLDYHHAYTTGAITPCQVAERIIAFLTRNEPRAHWVTAWDAAAVRREAAASSARHAARAPLSVLDGVPFAVKDGLHVAGYPTTGGTAFLCETPGVDEEMPAVTALRAAGAVCVGKAAMQELGHYPYGVNAHQGVSRNPHSLHHMCGGSSCGSGALVAAGVVPIALGTDGGGSIRVPAALCGVVGLKPTNGRLSSRGALQVDATVCSAGPLAASVADALVAYAAMVTQGGAPVPLALPRALLPPGPRPLEGLVVGVYSPWFNDAAPSVVAVCRSALERLRALGASLDEALALPELEEQRVAHTVTIASEMYSTYRWAADSAALRGRLGLDTRAAFALSAHFRAADYIAAACVRARGRVHFERAFERVHVIATPTVPMEAPELPPGVESHGMMDTKLTVDLMRFLQPANFLGYPALSLPVGASAAGLPIGLQLMGRAWSEATLLRAAAALEASLRGGAAAGGGDQGGAVPRLPALRINPLAAAAEVENGDAA